VNTYRVAYTLTLWHPSFRDLPSPKPIHLTYSQPEPCTILPSIMQYFPFFPLFRPSRQTTQNETRMYFFPLHSRTQFPHILLHHAYGPRYRSALTGRRPAHAPIFDSARLFFFFPLAAAAFAVLLSRALHQHHTLSRYMTTQLSNRVGGMYRSIVQLETPS
jgi:hypothetical protein